MNNGNDESTPKNHSCAPFKPSRGPTAGERLIREGFIAPEAYGRMFDAEVASWEEILSMDEATLDAELGVIDAAAINEVSRLATTRSPQPVGIREGWRIVKPIDPPAQPAFYAHHYQMRLAGVRDGLRASRREIEAELRDVQRLLMATAGGFLFDVFKNLGRYLDEGRLLLIEKMVDGQARLEGCVAFDHQDLICLEDGNGVVRRINVIRLLAARESEHRAVLAARLGYEAQLRGTVRAMQPGQGPACIGTLGIVPEINTRALKWAAHLDHRVRVVTSRSKAASTDPVLVAFRDQIAARPAHAGRDIPYCFVIADRMQLLEAARLHLAGLGPLEFRQDEPDMRLDYEVNDPCSLQVFKAATDLVNRDSEALQLFGLTGSRDATIWGPPAAPDMGVPIVAASGAANWM